MKKLGQGRQILSPWSSHPLWNRGRLRFAKPVCLGIDTYTRVDIPALSPSKASQLSFSSLFCLLWEWSLEMTEVLEGRETLVEMVGKEGSGRGNAFRQLLGDSQGGPGCTRVETRRGTFGRKGSSRARACTPWPDEGGEGSVLRKWRWGAGSPGSCSAPDTPGLVWKFATSPGRLQQPAGRLLQIWSAFCQTFLFF